MIFLSAGHHAKDPGAIGVNGRKEADETIKLRDAIVQHLPAGSYILDKDTETLGQYLNRIKTGTGSVVLDLHFNAFNGKATGVEVLVQSDADDNDRGFATDVLEVVVKATGIVSRGIKPESQSKRGRLGIMKEKGCVCLLEVCFIDNPSDMAAYDAAFENIASGLAHALVEWDKVI